MRTEPIERVERIELQVEGDLLQVVARYIADLPVEGTYVVYLHGLLGAGKSTFARYWIRAMGYSGLVKSPTYTLIESYGPFMGRMIYHLDCYRLKQPQEMMALDLESCDQNALFLIEWPEKGAGYLPSADIDCYLSVLPERGADYRLLEVRHHTVLG
jgi:tRNA threonylcarbamoyladenosine biosynthesis protein TsaE